MKLVLACLAALVTMASAKVYFSEKFDDAAWEDRWTVGSEWKPENQMGKWNWQPSLSDEADKGIQTGEDARFYSLTAPLDTEFTSEGNKLILSYTVRHEQNLDCGGSYIKLVNPGFDAKKFGGDTPYAVMFGPDVCGTSTRRTHAIFTYKGKNLLTKKNLRVETDNNPHRYTFVVSPDNTFEVRIDGEKVESGSLFDDWDFLAPKMIKDPAESKPADWVDEAKIPDPTESKPEGWDDIPAKIPDPEATQPEDWDEEEDGEWEPPLVSNPEYKGEWKPTMIDNPDYKGPWVHPEIPNPEYEEDDKVYAVCNPCSHVGFELWQVKAGTVFDDIIVTDSEEELKEFEDATFNAKKDAEKKALEAKKEAERKAEEEARKKAEEERKAAEAAEEDEDEDEDEDDEKDEL
ncbi:hypothetical protein FNF27_05826 [Cafeteria roenbergensis]|uniref:Calreticulin n=1 Tax=Cafeteria roenbergensis TaxID=33653 RepID=A0A5A8E4S4_CAFRO|nr:hypothetical protein FNF27_05826 [Cafeteria roenbergensis]